MVTAETSFGGLALTMFRGVLESREKNSEIDWLISIDWLPIFILMSLAIAVFAVGRHLQKTKGRWGGGQSRHRTEVDLAVAKLASLPPTNIAEAAPGPVRLCGTITSSAGGDLGSCGERARVWHNRRGASRDAAVALEVVLVGDDTGQVALENLAEARVIAPVDRGTSARESVSLYVGDRIEVLGHFEREVHGEDRDPKARVYGYVGRSGGMQIRVDARPADEAPTVSPAGALA